MNDDNYVYNELLNAKNERVTNESELKMMQKKWAESLKESGLGEIIKEDITRLYKPTLWGKIKIFFNKILNVL